MGIGKWKDSWTNEKGDGLMKGQVKGRTYSNKHKTQQMCKIFILMHCARPNRRALNIFIPVCLP